MTNHNLYDKYKRNQDAKRFYNGVDWLKARKLALIRDSHLCQECLKNKKITAAEMVHHTKTLEDYPELAYDLDNLVSLCNACHNKEHPEKGGGKKKRISAKVQVVEMKGNPDIL